MAPKLTKLQKTYTEEDVVSAVAAVKNGMSLKKASMKYGVPATTIHDKKSDKYVDGKTRPGMYIIYRYTVIVKKYYKGSTDSFSFSCSLAYFNNIAEEINCGYYYLLFIHLN
jgi:hypothetical protein